MSTPAVLPLHLLVPVVNNDISSPCEQIMVRTRSVGVNTCDVALATEPECLGPCEPGTSVNLEGIVWQETEDGKCQRRALCSLTVSLWSYGHPFLPVFLLCRLLGHPGLVSVSGWSGHRGALNLSSRGSKGPKLIET